MSTPKRCTRCKHVLPESHFHRNRSKADGFADWCKDCVCAHHRAKYRGRKYPAPNVERLLIQLGNAAGDVAGGGGVMSPGPGNSSAASGEAA